MPVHFGRRDKNSNATTIDSAIVTDEDWEAIKAAIETAAAGGSAAQAFSTLRNRLKGYHAKWQTISIEDIKLYLQGQFSGPFEFSPQAEAWIMAL